jgi:SpoVK/Ycf46/Vps4 family AAA+-type ATPase
VIAATNRIDNIDPAIRRRFDIVLTKNAPPEEKRADRVAADPKGGAIPAPEHYLDSGKIRARDYVRIRPNVSG